MMLRRLQLRLSRRLSSEGLSMSRSVEWVGMAQELSKARLSGFVATTALAGYASGGAPLLYAETGEIASGAVLTTLGVFGCSAAANSLNQLIERSRDARMARTARRPLASGRLRPAEALGFAAVSAAGGTAALACTGPLPAALGAANIVLYAGPYTLLKPQSELNTWVGAVVGAVPPVIGWSAAGASLLAPEPWLLALTLYLWQFPHFFALSWRHRADYARGGFAMIPCRDPTGDRTSRLVLRYSWYLALVPPAAVAIGAQGYMFGLEGLALNGLLLAAAYRYRHDRSTANAAHVFKVTLLYLPLLLFGFVLHSTALHNPTDDHHVATNLADVLVPFRDLGRALCVHELIAAFRENPTTPSLCPLDLTHKALGATKHPDKAVSEKSPASPPDDPR